MRARNVTEDPLDRLAAFLPYGADPVERIGGEEAAERFREDWQTLSGLGFRIVLADNAVQVFHGSRGFEFQIPVGAPVFDFEGMDRLFAELRRCFGRPLERWIPWLFQAGPAVTVPFGLLKNVILTADRVLGGRSAVSPPPGPGEEESLGI